MRSENGIAREQSWGQDVILTDISHVMKLARCIGIAVIKSYMIETVGVRLRVDLISDINVCASSEKVSVV